MKGRVEVGGRWFVQIDEAGNYMPMRKKVNQNTGEEYGKLLGYFSSMESALSAIVRSNAADAVLEEGMDIKSYVLLLKQERKELEALLKGIFDGSPFGEDALKGGTQV